ncbi:GNAT family N-acetyltransferase [Phaeovulum sp.]|uniref:GNAT family N-acetyltransferase n=1 Tax=Phaeovulum sp. TaxID=2934796 RepID=UPI0039E21434
MTGVILRDLSGIAEFDQAEALQRAVWGKGDKEDPADLMMVIQSEGGLVAGAFQGAELLGYVFAFPTRDPKVQHSHRLAVLGAARGMGLGAGLKLYQRDWCLSRGITHVRWTYDPIRAANAQLNVGRLGGRSHTYLPDYYGVMAGINAGVPSDRLMLDWHLDSPNVAASIAGQPPLSAKEMAQAERIAIPVDFGALLQTDPATAQGERLRVRAQMQSAFARGLEIAAYSAQTRDYLLLPR